MITPLHRDHILLHSYLTKVVHIRTKLSRFFFTFRAWLSIEVVCRLSTHLQYTKARISIMVISNCCYKSRKGCCFFALLSCIIDMITGLLLFRIGRTKKAKDSCLLHYSVPLICFNVASRHLSFSFLWTYKVKNMRQV